MVRTSHGLRFAVLVTVLSALVLACSDGDGSARASDDDRPGASSTSGTSADAPGGTFTLLSYNVAGLPQEVSKESPATNIPLISPLLDPFDLVLTQEDFDWWASDGLAAGLDFTNYHDRLRASATQQYRTERHPAPTRWG